MIVCGGVGRGSLFRRRMAGVMRPYPSIRLATVNAAFPWAKWSRVEKER